MSGNSSKRIELDAIYRNYQEDPVFEHMRKSYINFVGGRGYLDCNIIFVGEAPGSVENAKEQPFVGPAGSLLFAMVQESNLLSNYRTNVVKYWPTDLGAQTRKPSTKEIKASVPYLQQELEALGTDLIVPIGAIATKALWPEMDKPITKLVGDSFLLANGYNIFPMVHPAYILRNTQLLDQYRKDWSALGQKLRSYN